MVHIMQTPECTRFAFVSKLCAHLPKDHLIAAEERFAQYLDVVAQIASHRSPQAGDNGFDETSPAPYDSTPPAPVA